MISIKKILSQKIKHILKRIVRPKLFYFLSSSTKPISKYYGFDRGAPIDRFFIEDFLKRNKDHIQGACLELLNNSYTKKFGNERVLKSDILDIDITNKDATIIDDLRKLETIKDNSYDCIILTQVLQFIDDVDIAIAQCYRILKQNGTLLITLPSISRIDCISGVEGDFWRFTQASAKYIIEKKFESRKTLIESSGNARLGIYFYAGLSIEDISKRILKKNDPNFPLIITIRAIK